MHGTCKLRRSRRFMRAGVLLGAGLMLATSVPWSARAAEDDFTDPTTNPATQPPPANSETETSLKNSLTKNEPDWFKKQYLHVMRTPLPKKIFDQGGIPAVIPQLEIDRVGNGQTGSYQIDGDTVTKNHAFFRSIGTNGRSCVTCHQPASGMSVSIENIKKRLRKTKGTDPIFAPVDGANCPSLVPETETSGSLLGGYRGKGKKTFEEAHSLVINKGLFRIALPVPANAQFKITVEKDPTTCNTDPVWGIGGKEKMVSVFRRPLMSAHLHFKTEAVAFGPTGPVVIPFGQPTGNIMWDGREESLATQANHATRGHAQSERDLSEQELAQIIDFEMGIFSAQYSDKVAGRLDALGAQGGPVNLSTHGEDSALASFPPLPTSPFIGFTEYDGWATEKGKGVAADMRRSVARGQALFNGTAPNNRGGFILRGVSGFNDVIGADEVPGTCATCHNFRHAGSDILASAQRDVGIGGHATAVGGPPPSKDLPLFRIECTDPSVDLPFLFDKTTRVALTNDPGKALITGKCRDVGAMTVPGLRALSARAPYFHDGSAANLTDLVNIYNTRFSMGLTAAEKSDLVNFLSTL